LNNKKPLFCNKKRGSNNRTASSYLSEQIVLLELAPFNQTIKVAGHHRASPSATLDKNYKVHLFF